ncbi:signal transduction histidine kinase-like protein [Actinoplanes sp. N902-109]|nr:signal transduction histidine kinase-like protein [Actinoplanes sp. N902-109]
MGLGIAALLTLVGVPAGLAITGGTVDPAITAPLAVLLAGLVLLVRRWPVTVLLVLVLSIAALRAADLVGSGWVWPATAAFVVVMVDGRIRTAIVVGVVTLWYAFVWEHYVELMSFDFAAGRVGSEALWLAAVLAVTHAYLSTRRWQEEVASRLQQSLKEQELDARRRRAEERVDIARDLHDVVAHTLAVVGVHLNVALDAFDEEPEEARGAVRLAQDVRGRAMDDLQTLVGVLRRDDGDRAHGPVQLDTLLDAIRTAGLDVRLIETGERIDAPAPVATAVHRVVQEALTNTVRHARASSATVSVHYLPDAVTVEIADNGSGGSEGTLTEGHGIMGMRERVAALGGALTARAAPGGGFVVRASLPVSPPATPGPPPATPVEPPAAPVFPPAVPVEPPEPPVAAPGAPA